MIYSPKNRKLGQKFRKCLRNLELNLTEIFPVPGYSGQSLEVSEPTVDKSAPPENENLVLIPSLSEAQVKSAYKEETIIDDSNDAGADAHNVDDRNKANPEALNTEAGKVEETPSPKRSKRKAAIKFSNKLRDMIANSVLSLDTMKHKRVPKHGWDWEQFVNFCEENEEYFNHERKRTKSEDTSSGASEPDLEWDNSDDQYFLSFFDDNEDNADPVLESTRLFSSTDSDVDNSSEEGVSQSDTIDESTLDLDEESDVQEENIPQSKLTRSYAFRRKRETVKDATKHSPLEDPTGLMAPASSNDVEMELPQPQLLSLVLPERNPIIPETVNLGDGAGVQHLDQALAGVPVDLLEPNGPALGEDVQPLARTRQPINYKTFHNRGQR